MHGHIFADIQKAFCRYSRKPGHMCSHTVAKKVYGGGSAVCRNEDSLEADDTDSLGYQILDIILLRQLGKGAQDRVEYMLLPLIDGLIGELWRKIANQTESINDTLHRCIRSENIVQSLLQVSHYVQFQ